MGELVRSVDSIQQVLLSIVADRHRRESLHALPDPLALLTVCDVHIFDADVAAVGLLHDVADFAQGPLVFGGEDAAKKMCIDFEFLI